ncbi:ribonuclease-3 [Clostridium pascui]|uniref:ribonuclease III n=1 Tax=Clostridium pascui TaxID=46609 RepID=UPI00195B91FE|nr:ribonuclease III [Clostridium pascui]MBE6068251.1 ribonuclease III [Clostridium lundense]MBM7868950.1 ribonuclease-3 [Clostridium pascui]
MKRDVELKTLQRKLKVIFKDERLLDVAVTHSSYANQKKNIGYNERLEFLGDSVLQLIITEYLFKNYKNKSEGELSRKRSLIVCENSLFEVAQKWELGQYINMSKGEELTGGRDRISILADCVEAVIAAIYLDKGIEVIKEFVIRNFFNIIEKAMKDEIILDYKTKLQEKLQERGDVEIIYDLLKYEGPPHRRKFYTQVKLNDKILGHGSGYSKKQAEQNAAKEAIKIMEEDNE